MPQRLPPGSLLAADTPVPGTPLTIAIKSGQRAAAIDMIAKKSADVNAAEADGSTPLLWAANLNDTDLVARLLKAGANPNVRNQLGSTPLAEAAFNANTELIKALLDAGADPNAAGAGRPDTAHDRRADGQCRRREAAARQRRESEREGSAARADAR